ncbi:MAG: hypothetical protein H7210_13920 [Pyrinomonadaceae bacterium]|nr:hypothetical protein [Phycisphaerales bacterium]
MKKQVVGAIVGVLSIMSLGLARLEPPAKHVVDTDKLVAETQKDLPGKDSVGFVWWIPKEFWQACFAEEEDIPQEESDAIVEKIGRYTILMVVDGEINDEMEMTFVAESALRKGLKLIDPSGARICLSRTPMLMNRRRRYFAPCFP